MEGVRFSPWRASAQSDNSGVVSDCGHPHVEEGKTQACFGRIVKIFEHYDENEKHLIFQVNWFKNEGTCPRTLLQKVGSSDSFWNERTPFVKAESCRADNVQFWPVDGEDIRVCYVIQTRVDSHG